MKTGTNKKLVVYGPTRIRGEIEISGAKNSALPILAACILSKKTIKLHNIPKLLDIISMLEILSDLNVHICLNDNESLNINAEKAMAKDIQETLTKKTRASILLLGPLLSRYRKACIALPGGCNIGKRPIDIHINGLRAMGASIEIKNNVIHASCKDKLVGCTIALPSPSVGATENLIMAATLARGRTILQNIALEPEIFDLINLLNKMGASIKRKSNSLIIEGVDDLNDCEHTIIGDRLEAGTYLIAAAATQGEITINNINPDHLSFVLEKLTESGAKITTKENSIHLLMKDKPKPVGIVTMPYPGFPTDLQAQWLSLNIVASGLSHMKETIFENRLSNVIELRKLGAKIALNNNEIQIEGSCDLIGTHLEAKDLRASAGLIIAGLVAKGKTHIHNTSFIDRGYVSLEEKLRRLGAQICRTQSEKEDHHVLSI